MIYSLYFQTQVKKSDTWFLTATLRSFEHLCFDRALAKEQCLFEFFVPEQLESYFLELMNYYQENGIVTDVKKLPNRLLNPEALV
jgi:hypothetical protein